MDAMAISIGRNCLPFDELFNELSSHLYSRTDHFCDNFISSPSDWTLLYGHGDHHSTTKSNLQKQQPWERTVTYGADKSDLAREKWKTPKKNESSPFTSNIPLPHRARRMGQVVMGSSCQHARLGNENIFNISIPYLIGKMILLLQEAPHRGSEAREVMR